jgi:hypothetical protein
MPEQLSGRLSRPSYRRSGRPTGRRVGAVVAGTALAVGVSVVGGATPASAAPGCPYPYVCFYPTRDAYNAGRPVSRYRDVTSGWQYLRSQSIGSEVIANTRHDDVAYLHLAADPDHPYCLAPGETTWLFEAGVDRIRISTEATCP